MVTFICEACDKTLKKNQVDKHCETVCRNAWNFICIDCKKTFAGYEYEKHTSCLSEAEMTMGKFYKPKEKKVKTEGEANGNEKVANGVEKAVNGIEKTTNGHVKTVNEASEGNGNANAKAADEKNTEESKDTPNENEKNQEWLGWKKTIKAILLEKESDKMLLKNIKKCLLQILQANNFEIDDDTFNKCIEKHTKSSMFEIIDNKYIRYINPQEKALKAKNTESIEQQQHQVPSTEKSLTNLTCISEDQQHKQNSDNVSNKKKKSKKVSWDWSQKIIEFLQNQPNGKGKIKRVKKALVEQYILGNHDKNEEIGEEEFEKALEESQNIANDGRFIQLIAE